MEQKRPCIGTQFLVLLLLKASGLYAQADDQERLLTSDPEDLLEIRQQDHLRTATTDLQTRDVREAPANIQIITAKQIKASGARDLLEVLHMVPALAFLADDADRISTGVRGIPAGEGGLLFLLNGHRLNENDLGTYSIGRRIPLDNIERIEVTTGTGSIVHGGAAFLGSVNIITRTADHGSRARASLGTGLSNGQMTRNTVTLSGSQRLSGDQELGYVASVSNGDRSNATGTTWQGGPISFADSTGTRTHSFQLEHRWRSLRSFVAFMEEEHQVAGGSMSLGVRDVIFGLQQRIELGKGFDLQWRAAYVDQLPAEVRLAREPQAMLWNTSSTRSSGKIMVTYRPTTWATLRVGSQGHQQTSSFTSRDGAPLIRTNGQTSIAFCSVSTFAEGNVAGRYGSFTVGQQFEWSEINGHAFAPRIAYTRTIGLFHGKLMHAGNFRMPMLMHLQQAGPGGLAPERSTVTEAELGVRPDPSTLFTINVYRTLVDGPFLWNDSLGLINGDQIGTEGADLRFTADITSFTFLAGAGIARQMDLRASNDASVLATVPLPALRTHAMAAWKATGHLTLRCRGSYRSPVDQLLWHPMEEAPTVHKLPDELLLHAGIGILVPKLERLSIDLGCENLLDTPRLIPSATPGNAFPFRLNGREFTLLIVYRFIE